MRLRGDFVALDVVFKELQGFVQGEVRTGEGGFEEFEGLAERELRRVVPEVQAERQLLKERRPSTNHRYPHPPI